MIRCGKCGYVGEYKSLICPTCGERIVYGKQSADAALADARSAVKKKEYEEAVELYLMLSDMGITEAEREFGEILERGAFVTRDLDEAMELFLRAAKKNDARAAFRYSRLVGRMSDEAARFWLFFSAVLGCEQAYPVLAKKLSDEGHEELASYYYYLAAVCEDRESVAEMAMRYYRGVGVPRSEAYAKWYFDRFFIPPIYAIKTVYKLRAVKAEEPPAPEPKNYGALLRALADDARKYEIHTAYFYLNELLAKRGDIAAAVAVGAALVEGVGCEADIAKGIKCLESAAAHGSADAYGYLGGLYLGGDFVEQDTEKGIDCLKKAGEHGSADAYEILGDIYRKGDAVQKNSAAAVEYYDLARALGSVGGAEKAAQMRRRREDFFDRGSVLEDTAPEEAFRSYAISAAMGFLPAERRLARCYENGIGTERDRYAAFYWYKSASDKGDAEACFDLGRCYAEGIGVAFDYKKAIKMFMRSDAEPELIKARTVALLERKKKRLMRSMFSRAARLLHQRKTAPAIEILELCERMGHAQGIYTLGCLLEFGLGIKMDRDRAYALYERAYRLEFRDPRQVYKLIVLKMVR